MSSCYAALRSCWAHAVLCRAQRGAGASLLSMLEAGTEMCFKALQEIEPLLNALYQVGGRIAAFIFNVLP